MRNNNEKTITVDKKTLVKTLVQNKIKHVKEYEQALLDYKKVAKHKLELIHQDAVKTLEENYEDVLKKIEAFDPENPIEHRVYIVDSIFFDLKVPHNYEEQYELAIQMYNWEVDETVKLTVTEFQNFVMDNWEWQKEFKMLNSTYSVAASGLCT